MKIQAVISEYNPFHNGHLYQIQKSSGLTHSDYTIALMGGSFLQRGTPAMWDKYTRAKMCVCSSIDLCLELPFPYATGSAGDFAFGAVSILNSLSCVDYLCFGAECPDMDKLKHISTILSDEPKAYKEHFRQMLALGCPYPEAQARAIFHVTKDSGLSDIMAKPNNTLAIEYLTALHKTNSAIEPVLIERKGSYHDKALHGEASSASSIREALSSTPEGLPIEELLSEALPEATIKEITKAANISAPVTEDMLGPFVQSALLNAAFSPSICDMSEELCNRLSKININQSYSEIIDCLKTKNITEARIKRSILHMLLNYTQSDRELFMKNGYACYANILGFKSGSSKLLKHINNCSIIPLITKKADAASLFKKEACDKYEASMRMWELDTKATMLYNCLVKNNYGASLLNDFQMTPHII